MKLFRNILVSVFFIGYFPIASGTLASLIAAAFYIFCLSFLYKNDSILFLPNLILLLIIIILCFIFKPLVVSAERDFGKDSKKIVIDEVLGYLIAILFLPHTIVVAIYAFVFFRVFDIAKPPPIKQLELLPHGWGVIIDDLVAGLYTNIIIQILIIIFPHFF